jgi:hypothetical protein
MTPALFLQEGRGPNWMAHTPVGHDSWGLDLIVCGP